MKKIRVAFQEEIDLDLNLDGVISQLQKLRTKYQKEDKTDLELHVDSGWSNYTIYLSGERLETDEELQKRMLSIELNKKKEEQQKEKRRKEYFKLKKEFEK